MFSMLIEGLIDGFTSDMNMPFGILLFIEAFVSIHMTVFVFYPFSYVFFPKRAKLATITLFALRACILLILDFYFPGIAMSDFHAVFIGAFTVFPLFMIVTFVRSIKTKRPYTYSKDNIENDQKLRVSDIPKYRLIISIIYGIIGGLVLSSLFIFYEVLPVAISLAILTGFYIYVYIFYPKKYEYKEANETVSHNPIYLIYIIVAASALAFFKDPRIIYSCDDTSCKVVKYIEGLNSKKVVEIESSYKGKTVTTIGQNAFSNNKKIEAVKIPETVNSIKTKAFQGCNKIEYIEIKEGTSIEENAIDSSIEIVYR